MTKQIETIANDPHARYNKVAGGYATKLMNQKNAEIEDWIDEYNDVIVDINPTRSKLNNAFQDKLRANLSTNAYDAQNGNWTNVSDKNVEYWDDKPLRFTKHEGTGTYLVEQQDENGNWVAMGYTSKDIAYEYTQEFMPKEPPEPPVPQPEPTPDTQPESTWVGNEILKHEDIVVKPGEKIFLKPGNGETVYLASDPDMTVTYKYDVTSGTYKSDSPGDFNEYNPRDLITAHKTNNFETVETKKYY